MNVLIQILSFLAVYAYVILRNRIRVMKTVMSAKNATSRNILMHSMAGDKLIV